LRIHHIARTSEPAFESQEHYIAAESEHRGFGFACLRANFTIRYAYSLLALAPSSSPLLAHFHSDLEWMDGAWLKQLAALSLRATAAFAAPSRLTVLELIFQHYC
jgi:hypothetical protein